MKLATKVDLDYGVEQIHPRHWERRAKAVGLGETMIVEAIDAMTAALPEALATTAAAMRDENVRHPVVERLEAVLAERAMRVRGMS